jgi:AbiV family abortive infection protein
LTSKRLGPAEVHTVGLAAAENALAIMEDAKALLDAGRYQRAYALGVIATEEAAKFNLCRDALFKWTEPWTVAELNDLLKPKGAHVQRYVQFLQFLKAISPGAWPLVDLEEIAKEDMRARERTLYVDVDSSGIPRTPMGVKDEDAREWVSGMAELFLTFEKVWPSGLADALAEAELRQVSPKVSPDETS